MTSEDIPKSTCSQALPDGPLPSDSLAGGQTDLFGLPVAPARLSALQGNPGIARDAIARCLSGILAGLDTPSAPNAETNGTKTKDTSGPKSGGWSESADLQSALASRLVADPVLIGGPLYVVRWQHSDTLLGPPICRQRASARRTSDNDFSGWPSPLANKQSPQQRGDFTPNLANVAQYFWRAGQLRRRDHKDGAANLDNVAVNALLGREVLLTGWATTRSRNRPLGAIRRPDAAQQESAGRPSISGGLSPRHRHEMAGHAGRVSNRKARTGTDSE